MATVRNFESIISADSHVYEPSDLWSNALGNKFGERTPRTITNYQGVEGTYFYSGYQGLPVTMVRQGTTYDSTNAARMEANEKGFSSCGFNPEVRVQFQIDAGLDAEVMNPTTMHTIMRNPDVEVLKACSEVYNDWESEFVSYDPKRLIGVSVITLHDVEWAVAELDRTMKMGLMNPTINCQAPDGCLPYRDRSYDPFWAAVNEAGVPITLHILTGKVLDTLILARTEQSEEERGGNPGSWIDLSSEIQNVLANDFIFGGVLDRFPHLKLCCSEFEVSWVPGFMARLDQIEVIAARLGVPKLDMKGSYYMRSRICHGFIDDTAATHAVSYIGADQVVWGSDFPHTRSIGLDVHSDLKNLLKGMPEDDQVKIAGTSAAKLFNWNND